MEFTPKDEKIEKYLNELSEEYKELLFKALISQSNSVDDLSISELLRLDAEIKKPLHEDYARLQKRRKRLFTLGEIYIFMGFIMYVMFQIIISPGTLSLERITMLMSIIVILVGCSAVLLSFISPMTNISSKEALKTNDLPMLQYEVINKWRIIEGKVNDINGSSKVQTTKSIIAFLSETGLINDKDVLLLKDFLRMRNNIVHNTKAEYSEKEIKDTLAKVDTIIKKTEKLL